MGFVTFSSLYTFKGVYAPRFAIPHADKLVHFTFYFVACFLGMYFLREQTKGRIPFKNALVKMVVFTICFGAIIEVIQYLFTLTRTGDFLDFLANSIGAICGAVLVNFRFAGQRRVKWKV